MSTIMSVIAFLEANPNISYLILFLGSYFDTLFPMSFFTYGEIFFLSGAILAGTGYLNIWLVTLVCIVGGALADSSSFWMGKKYGQRLAYRVFKKENTYLNLKNYSWAKAFFHKYGKKSVFFARLLGPLAWVTPFVAGTFNIKYRDFIKYNLPGVIIGIGEFMIVGYFFGFAYATFLGEIQRYILIIILVVVAVALYLIDRKFRLVDRAKNYIIKKFF